MPENHHIPEISLQLVEELDGQPPDQCLAQFKEHQKPLYEVLQADTAKNYPDEVPQHAVMQSLGFIHTALDTSFVRRGTDRWGLSDVKRVPPIPKEALAGDITQIYVTTRQDDLVAYFTARQENDVLSRQVDWMLMRHPLGSGGRYRVHMIGGMMLSLYESSVERLLQERYLNPS